MFGLANDQLFNFAELVVGDADKVSTLGQVRDVDAGAVLSVELSGGDNTAAHIDERHVDIAANTLQADLNIAACRVGLESHSNIGSDGVESDVLFEGAAQLVTSSGDVFKCEVSIFNTEFLIISLFVFVSGQSNAINKDFVDLITGDGEYIV